MKLSKFAAVLSSAVLILGSSSQVFAAPTVIDLSGAKQNTTATTGTISDGTTTATYTWFDPSSTGTGVLNSFVQIGSGGNAEVKAQVSAYNTNVNGTLDNGSSPNFNRAITVGQIGFVDIDGDGPGQPVMRFVLDVNQEGGDPFIDLTDVQIFISTSPNQSTESFAAGNTSLIDLTGQLVYWMDAQDAGNKVILDYGDNTGSGSGDMLLDIPLSAFQSAWGALGIIGEDDKNNSYVYLFSQFGSDPYSEAVGDNDNNDGFEEWGYFAGTPFGEPPCVPGRDPACTPSEVPEPGMLSLLGFGLVGLCALNRRRRSVG